MDDASGCGPFRDTRGRFGAGNPGRPPGARNRLPRRIALSLLRNFEDDEEQLLRKLSARDQLAVYMRLIGRLLPRDLDEELRGREMLEPQDAPRVARALRHALEKIDAGEGALADIEAALADHGLEIGSTVKYGESAVGAPEQAAELEPRKAALELVPTVEYGESAGAGPVQAFEQGSRRTARS